MKREVVFEQPILLLENGKFIFKFLKIEVHLSCACGPESTLLEEAETEIREAFNFNGNVIASKTVDSELISAFEEKNVTEFVTVENTANLSNILIQFIQHHLSEKYGASLYIDGVGAFVN